MSSMADQLILRDQVHDALYQSLHEGEFGLKVVPELIKQAIQQEVWKERIVHQIGKEIPPFPSFRSYIEARPPNGLGATVRLVERMIEDPETLAFFRDAVTAPRGGDRKSEAAIKDDNVIVDPEQGNSRAYTLARLRRERPDLFDRVKAGEMSANGAAREAGWRKPSEPLQRVLNLLRKLSEIDRRTVRVALDELDEKERAA